MRERTLKSVSDKVMWLVIYMLPIILYVVASHHNALLSFSDFLNTSGLGILTNGVIHSTLLSIFGSTGLVPILPDNSFLLQFMTYAVAVTIIHIVFDVIVFIPRLFHNFLEKLDGGDLL